MKRLFVAASLLLLSQVAGAQSIPQMNRKVTLEGPTGLNWALSTKADVDGGSLKNAIVAANALHVPGLSAFVTCPINACITAASMGGNVYSPAEIQYVTQKAGNEEIGLNVSVLDNTGAGTEIPGAAISPGAKMAGYFGIMQTPQGGTAWGMNSVVTRGAVPYQPSGPNGEPGTGTDAPAGSVPASIGTIGYEADLNNRDQSGASGKPFIVNLYVAGSSKYTSTAGIFYAGNNGEASVPMYQYGIEFSGPSSTVGSSVGGAAVEDDSSATISLHTIGSHSVASIYDESTGPHSLWIVGTHTQQDIEINTSSPRQIQLDGASTSQSILDNTTGPHGYQVMGTHTGADIEIASNSPIAQEFLSAHSSEDQNINTTSPIGTLYQGKHSTADVEYFSSSSSAESFMGTYSAPISDYRQANATDAIAIKGGQYICMDGTGACVHYDTTHSKWVFSNSSGTDIASLDDSGNMTLKGTLTQSGTP
ncbi:hypothetical protein [Gluconobacter cerinus]|uniref:hypothetical protein n=1 Tax=Gluconobacter cerinus TaxID=38307 RepID=UPI001B8B1490|nr:hypothetical protein [Gluconobacter cerinus]MBS1037211.1 hypothetical protein [Gluconobacter cerinus]